MISVIICTYNPRRDYLDRTLAALRTQTLDVSLWDLLIVDNNSDTPLKAEGLVDWHPRGRVVREEEAGLTHARLRGIAETTGELLVFVDDDNVLAPDYLEEAVRIGEEYPFLGTWGAGIIEPEFEEPPADFIRKLFPLYAVRCTRETVWCNSASSIDLFPIGAGLIVRSSVATAYANLLQTNSLRRSLDRKGAIGLSGGDTDFVMSSCSPGSGYGTFPTLTMVHLIPRRRLTMEYACRLAEGSAASGILIRHLHGMEFPKTRPISPWERILHRLKGKLRPNPFREIEWAKRRGRLIGLAMLKEHGVDFGQE